MIKEATCVEECRNGLPPPAWREGVGGRGGAVYEYDSDREVRKSPEKVL